MQAVYCRSLDGRGEINKVMHDGRATYMPVDIYQQPLYKANKRSPHFIFRSTDVDNKLNILLENWLKKADLLNPIYNLYFSTLYKADSFLENRFLSLVQGLEAYHARIVRNTEFPREDYLESVASILESVPDGPPGFAKWLGHKLENGNRPSLRHRLKELITPFLDVFKFSNPGRQKFIKAVVDTRNYLTHYSEDLKGGAAKGSDLVNLIETLKMLFELYLLKEMGFSVSEIKAMVAKNGRYQQRLARWTYS